MLNQICLINATNLDFENVTGADTSDLAKNTGLANLKYDVDKLDIEKLETTPVDLSKLSDAVKNKCC